MNLISNDGLIPEVAPAKLNERSPMVPRVGLLALLFLLGCGSTSLSESRPNTTAVNQLITTTSSTTSTTEFKGKDCNESKLQEYFTDSAYQSMSNNASPEELRSIMMTERQRIRRLDLPSLQREQNELVDSMEEAIIELTQALANQRRGGAYDAALLRWQDAGDDFRMAYVRECRGR